MSDAPADSSHALLQSYMRMTQDSGVTQSSWVGGVLPDALFHQRILLPDDDPLRLRIDPYSGPVSVPGRISYGQSSYGYDLRAARKYLIFSDVLALVVDPLDLDRVIKERTDSGQFVYHEGDACLIPPNSFALAESMETIRIPRDCIALMLGKSTYARCGINLNMTPLEPEWRGVVTIEIANMTRLPARIHSNQGIGQMLLFKGAGVCRTSYADKRSRYQDQTGLTLPRAT